MEIINTKNRTSARDVIEYYVILLQKTTNWQTVDRKTRDDTVTERDCGTGSVGDALTSGGRMDGRASRRNAHVVPTRRCVGD